MQPYQPFTKTKKLFQQLVQWTVEGITIMAEMRQYQRIYLAGAGHDQVLEIKKAQARKELRNNLYQLKRSNYIAIQKYGEKLIINLTDKGKRETLKYQITKSPLCKTGFSTIIIFDIPEKVKIARQQLRIFLHETNFKQVQKSVWLNERDAVKPLQQFLKLHNLTKWVKVFRAETIL